MLPDKTIVMKESQRIYQVVRDRKSCSFDELQSGLGINNVNLCMALIELIRDGKISQQSLNGNVSYTIRA